MSSELKLGLRRRIALEAFRYVHKDKVAKHQLRTLFWECTLRCNLSCKHCGSDCKTSSGVDELSVADFIGVIDQITPEVDPSKLLVIFTGGEALVRRDIEECGLELYKRGFPWGIVTNGMLLDAARLNSLQRAGLHSLTISLDGFEEAHNYLRGNPKSYQRAIEAIKLMCQTKELNWDVVTCVNPMNLGYLAELRDFLANMGLKKWRLFTIFPVGRAASDPNLQLSDKEFVSLMEFIAHSNQEENIHIDYGCEGFLGPYEGIARKSYFHCNAGVSTASILCDGTISACPSIRSNYYQGNIKEDRLMDVWNNRYQQYRNKEWAKTGICSNCKMWRFCQGNGMHLRDDDGKLLVCHYQRIKNGLKASQSKA